MAAECRRRACGPRAATLESAAWRRRPRSSSRPTSPGPRAREILDAQGARHRGAALDLPAARDRRGARRARSPTSTATRSSTSPAGSAASTSATRTRASSRPRRSRWRASRTPTSRSSRTRTTSSWPSASSRSLPISGETRAAFFNAGAEAVENAVKFARCLHEAARRDRLRRRLPRPHADGDEPDVEDAPVQGGPGPVRARGLPRLLPGRLPRARTRETALAELERAFKTRVAAEEVAAIILEPVQGESGFIVAAAGVPAGRPADLRRARHRPHRRRGADRLRPHRARCSRSSTSASSPT